uniref:RRM domain-containing protein n=1 Tax=Equus caballus TaxID=9796 RepID=A0A3Q2GWJ1_HORSE
LTFVSKDLNCQEDPMNKLKGQKVEFCRICKATTGGLVAPHKDTLWPVQKELAEKVGLSTGKKAKLPKQLDPMYTAQNKTGNHCGKSTQPNHTVDDNAIIFVSTLSEDTHDTDLQELFQSFGSILCIYLAKDKTTGQSKGFAVIRFHSYEDTSSALADMSSCGCDHLILSVKWVKPSTN